MTALTLRLRIAPTAPVDASQLTPEHLAGRSPAEAEKLAVPYGNRRIPLGELFQLTAGDAGHVVIEDASPRLHGVGRGLTGGRIDVEGDAGHYLAAGMRAGWIFARGAVGHFAAAGMRGGFVHVRGSTGSFLAAAPVGERFGMRGGTVVVDGNAGERACDRMRRGIVLIRRDAGAFCVSRMVAGTVIVLGELGFDAGFGMRRGTVLLAREPEHLLPTFVDGGRHELRFVRLVERHLGDHGIDLTLARRFRRHTGDLAAGGKGEILVGEVAP